ncbi:alpha/beta hydrolase-fold protein [Gracilimonas sp.]|uniref:alpha/beta hydrolase n=1 Tax=Gracilimonas sp. TaxID=1974203 RepID=UPI0032EF712A
MRQLLSYGLFGVIFFHLFFPHNISAQSVDTVYFSLDMTEPISEGWLKHGTEIVGIRGDQSPLNWGNTFEASDPDKDGIYEVAVPFNLHSDSLLVSFKIKVDGVNNPDDGWQKGRNHEAMIYQGVKNKVTLKWADEPPQAPTTITGQVEIFRDFQSDNLVPRDLYVYLPPGYKESNQRYPVLYMHDGQALFDASEIGQEWRVDEAAEELIRAGEIEPVIIVGIGNTQNRFDEYTPTEQVWRYELNRISSQERTTFPEAFAGNYISTEGDTIRFKTKHDTLLTMIPGGQFWQPLIPESEHAFFLAQAGITFTFDVKETEVNQVVASKPTMGGDGDLYGGFIIKKVKPFIDQNFRTRPEREFTSLGGSSLGGLITLYLGLEYQDTFSNLLVVSPSVWWDGQMIISKVNELPGATNQHIWLDMGTAEGEGAVESAKALNKALLNKGWSKENLNFVIEEGAAHNERAWAKRVPDMLRFLYSKN